MKEPVLSVITVTFNALPLLEITYQSVFHQTYKHIEYIVVDGLSKDGTSTWLQKNDAHISKWISEPDKGIYDAMNKGLSMATGDFVLFLNAGDSFPDAETVSKIMHLATPTTDVLYGEVIIVDEQGNQLGLRSDLTNQKLPDTLTWKSLRYGMVVSHQAFIPRRTITPPFISNNIAADIDWVIAILRISKQITNTRLVIAHFLKGGISTRRYRRAWIDRFKVLQKHFGLIPNVLAHVVIVLRAIRNKHLKGTA